MLPLLVNRKETKIICLLRVKKKAYSIYQKGQVGNGIRNKKSHLKKRQNIHVALDDQTHTLFLIQDVANNIYKSKTKVTRMSSWKRKHEQEVAPEILE